MVPFSRRRFVERLALGAGAAVLAPVAARLVGEARGEVHPRSRCFFYVVGNGIHSDWCFAPPEHRAGPEGDLGGPVPEGTTRFTWPAMVARLARHRQRVLLIDGLANRPRTGEHTHSAGFAALSCAPSPGGLNNESGPPGGITIDQFIADRIGGETRFRSVLFGACADEARPQIASVFARGRGRPEPHLQSPGLLYRRLFGAPANEGAGRGARRILVDGLREDVARLRGALAGEERRKLDDYLAVIEDLDRRAARAVSAACGPPPRTAADGARLGTEDRLELMNEMTAVALACGMTNVVGVAVGTGYSHRTMPLFPRLSQGLPEPIDGDIGHAGREAQASGMNRLHDFNLGLVARMLDVLATIPEGDGTAADTLVGIYTSDNGERHHSTKDRWPAVVLGDVAGRRLRTGGRFVRLPPGDRALADLYCSLAGAVGAPTNSFGAGGNEPVRGPLELLAP